MITTGLTFYPLENNFVGYLEIDDKVEFVSIVGQQRIEENSLRRFSWKSVQDPILLIISVPRSQERAVEIPTLSLRARNSGSTNLRTISSGNKAVLDQESARVQLSRVRDD